MSWQKVKTLLIVLFIFVNAFLIYKVYLGQGNSDEVPQETINETVKILERNNVKIDENIIKRKSETLKKAEISNSIDRRGSLAKQLLGNCSETETGYKSSKGTIDFSSVAFTYKNSDNTLKKKISDSDAIEKTVEFLNEKGFDVQSSGVRDFTVTDEAYIVRFGKEIAGYNVFESYLETTVGKDGKLIAIEGYWPEVNQKDSSKTKLINETTVLINLLSAYGFDTSVQNEIVDIQTGYTLGSLPEQDSPILLTLLPAYRVILKNGENYIFDATTGGFIYKY